jgi:hypothetical protein
MAKPTSTLNPINRPIFVTVNSRTSSKHNNANCVHKNSPIVKRVTTKHNVKHASKITTPQTKKINALPVHKPFQDAANALTSTVAQNAVGKETGN